MKHKILIAYDDTENALRALEYTANIVKLNPDYFHILLFFVLPPLPTDYIEYAELPADISEQEALKQRQMLLQQLKKDIEGRSEKIFDKALKLLKTYNITNVECKFSHCTTDVAGEIIQEVINNSYKTVVIGRKGKASLKERLLGGTAEKVIRYLKNCAVWVVE